MIKSISENKKISDKDLKIIKVINDIYEKNGEIKSDKSIEEIKTRISNSGLRVTDKYLQKMLDKSQEMLDLGIGDTEKKVVKEGSYKDDYILIDENGNEVEFGSEVKDFRGDTDVIVDISKFPDGASTGKVVTAAGREFFPGVFNLKIVPKDYKLKESSTAVKESFDVNTLPRMKLIDAIDYAYGLFGAFEDEIMDRDSFEDLLDKNNANEKDDDSDEGFYNTMSKEDLINVYNTIRDRIYDRLNRFTFSDIAKDEELLKHFKIKKVWIKESKVTKESFDFEEGKDDIIWDSITTRMADCCPNIFGFEAEEISEKDWNDLGAVLIRIYKKHKSNIRESNTVITEDLDALNNPDLNIYSPEVVKHFKNLAQDIVVYINSHLYRGAIDLAQKLINQINYKIDLDKKSGWDLDTTNRMVTEDVETTLAGPKTYDELELSRLIADGIKDEYETIKLYNDIAFIARERDRDDIAKLIDNINTEENNHVGMLQQALRTISANADAVEDGDKEAFDYLGDDDFKVDTNESFDITEDHGISTEIDEYQKWVDYDMKKYGKISDTTKDMISRAGFEIIKDKYGDYEVIAKSDKSGLADVMKEYQKWVDYDLKKYGVVSNKTQSKIEKAGFTLVKDDHGDYEVID